MFRIFILMIMVTLFTGCAGNLKKYDSLSPEERKLVMIEEIEDGLKAGNKYVEKKRFERAEAVYLNILQINSKQPEVFNNLGFVYKEQGAIDKALKVYQTAIELSPNYFEAHNNLAILYRETGEFEKAEEEYKKAILINPEFSDSYYNIGVLYDLYLGNNQLALESFRKYMELVGEDAEVAKWIKELKRR